MSFGIRVNDCSQRLSAVVFHRTFHFSRRLPCFPLAQPIVAEAKAQSLRRRRKEGSFLRLQLHPTSTNSSIPLLPGLSSSRLIYFCKTHQLLHALIAPPFIDL